MSAAPLALDLPEFTGDYVWAVDQAASKISFIAKQGAEDVTGEFTRFAAQIRLNPDDTADGKIYAVIDLASVETGDEERNTNLPSKEWFDVTTYPTAVFSSEKISRQNDTNFIAKGLLTIKEISRPLDLRFHLIYDTDHATADASLTLDRSDFNVGVGPYANEDWIAFGVEVEIHIAASR